MSIREKVYELLEAVESSAEMLDTNETSWESRKLDRESGEFIPDEITDPENLDRNRIDHELPLNISTHERNSENGEVIDGATIVIGVEQEDECDGSCLDPNCPCHQDEHEHNHMHKMFHNYVYGESTFLANVQELLKESDVEGIKKYNMDGRVTANMVKRALDAKLPELSASGLQVEQRTRGNRNEEEYFIVTGVGDAKLPETLEAEIDNSNFAKMVLDKTAEGDPMYRYAEFEG